VVRTIMNNKLKPALDKIPVGVDAIYSGRVNHELVQDVEVKLREKVAARQYDNYMEAIAASHSIPVMDHEVDQFLLKMPKNAIILDVGGCWGWHWRRLAETRSDVSVVIIDFVRANLVHAKNVLGTLVDTQVFLMEADATALPFKIGEDFTGFDGVWTVQTFQHIPDFSKAVSEAWRVLQPGGYFANYSLHITPMNRLIYRLLGKKFHISGEVKGSYYLERANQKQRDIIAAAFGASGMVDRYTECIFHPDLKFGFTGKERSLLGGLDILLSKVPLINRLIARQRGFLARKSVS
jgi:ubiquinone/menaquinone biosynthesis C-methylase UbiE